jgi:OOP family OmpA-OmpF porin
MRNLDTRPGSSHAGKLVTRISALAVALSLSLFLLSPLGAPIASAGVELTPYAGYTIFDSDLNLKDKPTFGGKLGFYFGHIGIEGNLGYVKTEIDSGPPANPDLKILNYSGDLVFRFTNPEESKVIPYILGGVGATHINFDDSAINDTTRISFDAGAGLVFKLSDMIGLRLEGRDLMFKLATAANDNIRHNIILTGGLSFMFGGAKDTDKDGVKDKNDKCPDTPLGARVDADGCPIDSDHDGVADGIDQCPDTPAGATVDAKGCPTDSDKDGVFDGIDQCPDTPAGVPVDARGCPKDSDGDGVSDDKDQCPDTPAGVAVDEKGCPKDSDGDGVTDDKDLCPNTPAGARVDKDGCPIEITEKETEMLDKGKITVHNILFETNKADIKPESENVLNEIGQILIQWPQLQIEIGGHTDARGTEAHNQELSEARANSVRDWLTSHFPQINAANLTAKGYGESQPIGSNKTAKGMAQNRRVEFKVLNTEELTKFKERRKTLMKE